MSSLYNETCHSYTVSLMAPEVDGNRERGLLLELRERQSEAEREKEREWE